MKPKLKKVGVVYCYEDRANKRFVLGVQVGLLGRRFGCERLLDTPPRKGGGISAANARAIIKHIKQFL